MPRRFATTHWSVVLAAGGPSTPDSQQALAVLCATYWYPLYAYLRRRGHDADAAQDLTQGFFTRVLEKDAFACASRDRGRFRSFLLASLEHYVSNERDYARALKRGGPRPPLPLEIETAEGRYCLEPRDETTPERIFDRRWAVTLLERVLTRLRGEFRNTGKEAVFERLRGALAGEGLSESYAEAGRAIGMSEGAVKVAVHRMRRRFRELLEEEIAQTVASPDEIQSEIRYLIGAIGS